MTKNIIAIVQARMGSSRLPGKVLKEVLPGRSLLSLMFERLRASKFLTKLVVATSTSSKDDKLIEHCTANNIATFRGSEDDVLGRYAAAAKHFNADVVVRLCADSPLHDAEIIDRCIDIYLKNERQADFVCNVMPNTFPYGTMVEVLPLDVLLRIDRLTLDPALREHVTQYIHQNPTYFHSINVENTEDVSEFRWAVDYPEDFEFAVEVYSKLYEANKLFSWRDVVSLQKAAKLEFARTV